MNLNRFLVGFIGINFFWKILGGGIVVNLFFWEVNFEFMF